MKSLCNPFAMIAQGLKMVSFVLGEHCLEEAECFVCE